VRTLCDHFGNIPTDFESLNVHVALSIALYEAKRQREFKAVVAWTEGTEEVGLAQLPLHKVLQQAVDF